MVRNALRLVRQWFCVHHFRISCIRRTAPGSVECACERCGKRVSAPYGLALPGTLGQ